MTLELWVFWGMLGSLGIGYLAGRRSRQAEVAMWKRNTYFAWRTLYIAPPVKDDADAVERLIRETRL